LPQEEPEIQQIGEGGGLGVEEKRVSEKPQGSEHEIRRKKSSNSAKKNVND